MKTKKPFIVNDNGSRTENNTVCTIWALISIVWKWWPCFGKGKDRLKKPKISSSNWNINSSICYSKTLLYKNFPRPRTTVLELVVWFALFEHLFLWCVLEDCDSARAKNDAMDRANFCDYQFLHTCRICRFLISGSMENENVFRGQGEKF